MRILFFLFCSVVLFPAALFTQGKQYRVGAIAFYNFENLFDPADDPEINDEEFTPEGLRLWTEEVYREKLSNLARVVSELGTDLTPDGVAILGVAEIENRKVLEDFARQEQVAGRNYQVVHFDSPDRRGIDVALLYQPKYFRVTASRPVPLLIYENDTSRIYTRDILYVAGEFDGEPLHVLVNHWPSRRGGESASQPYRNAAALLCKNICDSLMREDPNAKIIIMGDLNDDPVSPSIKDILNAQGKVKSVRPRGLYNPMYDLFKKGLGTLAYQDAWSLFDQLILSYGLINPKAGGYQYYQARVYNPKYLFQKTGRFQGYPFRTFDFDNYIGGYSDHFPVFVFLVKEVSP